MTAPTIDLQIYEGPTYSEEDNVCYYRITAVVTGDPTPTVEFSRDDSLGAWGPNKIQINLNNTSETYTLTATATNSAGSADDSIELSWGCPIEFESVTTGLTITNIPILIHPSDIGYVIGGDGVNTESLIIGDSVQNKGVMGYFAFDLSSFSEKTVTSASLSLKTYRNNPYLFEFVFNNDANYNYVFSSTDLKKVVQESIDGGYKLQFYLASMVVGDSDNDYQTDGGEFTRETISLTLNLHN